MVVDRANESTLRHGTRTRGWWAICEIALIFAVFFVHAGWPVPDVNEPHYLSKAKHHWDPAWCPGDFFLDSADAHSLFYWMFGWLTLWLPLAAVAWLGRLVTWALLAWAWFRLSTAFVPRPLYSALSAALLVCLMERMHMAGEWMVGGVEAKGFAYVLVLLGLGAMVRGRWNLVWLLLGAATAVHVLVGGWSVLSAAGAWIWAGRERPSLGSMTPGLVAGLLVSLVGVIPALALSWDVEPSVVREANQIYAFQRLRHHLALFELPTYELVLRLVRHGALLAIFLTLCSIVPEVGPHRCLRGFVLGAVVIALMGLMISFTLRNRPDLAAGVLRYYWFRLSDVALPLGVAITSITYIATVLFVRPKIGVSCLVVALIVSVAHLGVITYERHHSPYPRADRKMRDANYWRDVCDWISNNIPDGARYLTPRQAHTFKWYTGQAEVVTQKDIPQNARGIVQWWRRIDTIHRHGEGVERSNRESLAQQGDALLARLGTIYEADYLVTTLEPPLHFELLYSNGTYGVYRLPMGGAVRGTESEERREK